VLASLGRAKQLKFRPTAAVFSGYFFAIRQGGASRGGIFLKRIRERALCECPVTWLIFVCLSFCAESSSPCPESLAGLSGKNWVGGPTSYEITFLHMGARDIAHPSGLDSIREARVFGAID
jgi:hypothetical protein